MWTNSAETARLISEIFPKDIKIADVCCGTQKRLTNELTKLGFTFIKSYDDNLQRHYTASCARKFNLLVAENPCRGMDVLIESAIKYKKELFFVPCSCGYGKYFAQKFRKIRKLLEETHTVKYFSGKTVWCKTIVTGDNRYTSKHYNKRYLFIWATPK